MKIRFIRPNLADIRSSDAMEPLSFAILAALTPSDVEVQLLDERLESVCDDSPVDLVAMTIETYTARRAYQIAAYYRARGVKVVAGGYHPTFLPDEVKAHVDAVVIGDAEGTWPRVVADAQAGRLERIYRKSGLAEVGGIAPQRGIFAGKRYLPLDLVYVSRGCRFTCDFCSIHAFYGSTIHARPPADVVAEIAALGGRRVCFVDDNIMADPQGAAELFRALIPLRIRWSCQISIDVCAHPQVLKLMAQSGCEVALVGLESLDPRNLLQMQKSWAVSGVDYATAIGRLQDHGIMVYGSFALGYDHDTPASFDATVDFATRTKLFLANFNPLSPMPGTALYNRLRAEGRLLFDKWWLDPSFRYGQAMFRPRRMTPEQLTEGCFRAREAFNTAGSMLYRAMDLRTNCRSPARLGTFFLGNLVSRREIYRKQGMSLGALAREAKA